MCTLSVTCHSDPEPCPECSEWGSEGEESGLEELEPPQTLSIHCVQDKLSTSGGFRVTEGDSGVLRVTPINRGI